MVRILLVSALCAATVTAGADDGARQLGLKVRAVDAAIHDPAMPGAMRAITDLGLDSRYHTMVRGWLVQQLQGDKSIVSATGAGGNPRIEARIRFLEEAIRAIDLE